MADVEHLQGDEAISQSIDNITDAYDLVIWNAGLRVLGLDWKNFGLDSDKLAPIFVVSLLNIMRNSELDFPFDYIDADEPGGASKLANLPPHFKMRYSREQDKYWLYLKRSFGRDEALLARDLIWVGLPSYIAKMTNIDPKALRQHFTENDSDGSWKRLVNRVDANINGCFRSLDFGSDFSSN